jgi:hypothetical protein
MSVSTLILRSGEAASRRMKARDSMPASFETAASRPPQDEEKV